MFKPRIKPQRPFFSSGPCVKNPDWSLSALSAAALGRSHRSSLGKAKLREAILRTRAILQIPDDYKIAIVPGSDTGAMEMVLWSLLGERGVDVLCWESFGALWARDIVESLGLEDVRVFEAPYGGLPDLNLTSPERDIVFTWNGTTSGVVVPDSHWISEHREGLTFCDATSAVFSIPLDFYKLDVVTFSWQKALGAEAAHGMVVLSPRALARLARYTPSWPIPKLFRLADKKIINEGIFEGETLNTPSLLCVEDYLVALAWAERAGGLQGLVARCKQSSQCVWRWLAHSSWARNLAQTPEIASPTSVCFTFRDATNIPEKHHQERILRMVSLLEAEGVGYDLKHHKQAPPGFRIWCGNTVDLADVEALLPWLDWAYSETSS